MANRSGKLSLYHVKKELEAHYRELRKKVLHGKVRPVIAKNSLHRKLDSLIAQELSKIERKAKDRAGRFREAMFDE